MVKGAVDWSAQRKRSSAIAYSSPVEDTLDGQAAALRVKATS